MTASVHAVPVSYAFTAGVASVKLTKEKVQKCIYGCSYHTRDLSVSILGTLQSIVGVLLADNIQPQSGATADSTIGWCMLVPLHTSHCR